jgi:hypothetical protein
MHRNVDLGIGFLFLDLVGAQGIKLRLSLSEDQITPLSAVTKAGLVEA